MLGQLRLAVRDNHRRDFVADHLAQQTHGEVVRVAMSEFVHLKASRKPLPLGMGRNGGARTYALTVSRVYCKGEDGVQVPGVPRRGQRQVLARTFGCVRVVWNRTLADRHTRYCHRRQVHVLRANRRGADRDEEDTGTRIPQRGVLGSAAAGAAAPVRAFQAFFAKRARYPRFKSRYGKQSATYTRAAFSMRGGVLRLAKTSSPLEFVWSWPDLDPRPLDPRR